MEMRGVSLRWGLITGVAGAFLGIAALLAGTVLEPIKSVTTAEAVALAFFVRGLLAYASLGLALGLAYYGGLRVARARNQHFAAQTHGTGRVYSLAAGGIAMLVYWLITSIYVIFEPATPAALTSSSTIMALVQARLVFGAICILAGIGLGGIGGRASSARLLLDALTAQPALPVAAQPVTHAEKALLEENQPTE